MDKSATKNQEATRIKIIAPYLTLAYLIYFIVFALHLYKIIVS